MNTVECDVCQRTPYPRDDAVWLVVDDELGHARKDVCSPTCLIELAVGMERKASHQAGFVEGANRHLRESRRHWWSRT